MKTFWIIALFLASFCVYSKAQGSDDYDDYYNYDNFEDIEKKLDEEISKLNEKTDIDNDLKVEEEIQQFRESDKNDFDAVDEPIEDGFQEDKKEIPLDNDGFEGIGDKLKKSANEPENNDYNAENRPDEESAVNHNKDYALLWGDDSVAPLPVPEISENDENKDIIEETQKILEEDADNFEEAIKKEIGDLKIKNDDQPNLEQIVDETRKLLSESDDSFSDDNTLNKKNEAADDENINKENNDQDVVEKKEDADEEDTVDKAYADLNADLDKLFATLDKLKDDGSDHDSHVDDIEKVLDEADKLFEDDKNDDTNVEGSEELTDDNNDDDMVDFDKILEDILGETDAKPEDSAAEDLKILINDALNEPNPDDTLEKDVESLDAKLKPILYLNDALVDESKDAETVENKAEDKDSKENNANASVEKESEVKTALVDDLTSAEMEDLVSQFSILHSEDLDVKSDNFDKNVAPIHLKLKLDEATIITSPEHPNPYPTNNIVDWVIEGEGMGIELNITEFAVNGALGDYLLIKPGGVDDSGHDGLLFTYRLSSERRYRFTDVDRLFMRFESKLGMMFFRGFVISAKMIAPLPGDPEPVPEPEAVVLPPYATTTLYLAVPVRSFREIKEDFRQVLVDMTAAHIMEQHASSITLDLVSNLTQITGVELCPMSWPHYEGCSAVTFGVTAMVVLNDHEQDLKMDEDDLQDMWDTYSRRDPFALRLNRMGISEFEPPSSAALTAWLVIAGGVVISMALLAFVLWRYSCFEDYTRMKTYSDTDSLHAEKRNLDLYPTPHQTLPPLYAENEYKWQDDDSARVDMGGFANRSYAQENMYDFESDEEVVTPRDRNGVITIKDNNSSDV